MFDRITYLDVIQRDLKVMDTSAISLCRERGLPIHVFNLNTHGNIARVVTGEKVGTVVCREDETPPKRRQSQKERGGQRQSGTAKAEK